MVAMVGKLWFFCFQLYLLLMLLQLNLDEAIANKQPYGCCYKSKFEGGKATEGSHGNRSLQSFCNSLPDSTQIIASGNAQKALKQRIDRTIQIGVPANINTSHKFVKPLSYDLINGIKISGFSINRSYPLVPFTASHDDLVKQVYSKGFDAAVGDVGIFADRSRYADFSKPYVESSSVSKVEVDGLSLEHDSLTGLFIISGSITAIVLSYAILKMVAEWLGNGLIQTNEELNSAIEVEIAVSVGEETEILSNDV